jgi:Flp pilus assembly protein TadG
MDHGAMSNGRKTDERGFLVRLLRDARGNTFALIAAAMIPLLGLVGGGVDMSRLYLTKSRLQQACDAGALAGRKAMGVGTWTTGTTSTDATAKAMFDGNFKEGDYGTGTLTRSFSESSGDVSGTATVVVPMAVMKAFGISSRSITVNCTAKMAIPNTDVMFVLDNTGSMSCPPDVSGGGCSINSDSKITGLKSAVKCFYEALVKVNTAEVCGSDPTATTYSGTAQIRIGFVPYSVNVNVGKLLQNSWFANSWNYQTRTPVKYSTGAPTGSAYDETSIRSSNRNCNNWATGEDTSGFPADTDTPDSFTATTTTYTKVGYDSRTQVCTRRVDQSTVTYTRDDTSGTYFHTWQYKQSSWNISGLKAGGSSWNNSINLPVGTDGASTAVSWDGCIEERQTFRNTDSANITTDWATIPASAYDMDIDMVPDGTSTKYWGPILNGAVWARYDGTVSCGRWSCTNDTTSNVTTSDDLSRNDYYVCPVEAKRLQTWTTASPFVTYVDSLTPNGNTYHDIGMIWGARFISPTGIFATDNTNLSNIQRHIIFMTDGDTNVNYDDYSAYGVHWWDRRQTSYAPSDTNLNDLLNARLSALCTAIKNKNITLWVVSFGEDVASDTRTRLQNCASPGKFYNATDSATLLSNFRSIASSISQLRLTN